MAATQFRYRRFIVFLTLSMVSVYYYFGAPKNIYLVHKVFFRGSSQKEASGLRRIVFLNTGGHGLLSARQACSVESAARHHPSWRVDLLSVMNNKSSNESTGKDFSHVLKDLPNIVKKEIKPQEVFRGTPLEQLYQSGVLNKSSYPVVHLSDVLRLAEIFQRGGIYLDLDVVVMRSLATIEIPFVSQEAQNDGNACINSFLGFEARDPFLQYAMTRASLEFSPQSWNSIGPRLISNALRQKGRARYINELVGRQCNGSSPVKVLPHQVLLPVDWTEWNLLFNSSSRTEALRRCAKSYLMHVFSHLSYNTSAEPGSAYRTAAERFCPKAFQESLNLDGIF